MPHVRSMPTAPAMGPLNPPSRPRRRRANPLVVGGVLAAAVAALGFAALYGSAADTTAVLMVARPVAAGHALVDADLAETQVRVDAGVAVVPAARRSDLLGRRPAVPLAAGALLAEAQLAPERPLAPGTVVAALALKPGAYPPSLRPGDVVDVVTTGPTGGAEAGPGVLAPAALVSGVDRSATATVVSVVVDQGAGPAVVAAAGAGQVGLLLEPGR